MAGRKSKAEVETELKIKLSLEDLERVLEAFRKKAVPGSLYHKYMPRAYYDTSDLKLYKRGASLRVQYAKGRAGDIGGHEQTLKYDMPDGRKGDAFSRREVRESIDTHLPDFSVVKDSEAKKIISGISDKSLKHIFTAAIERRYLNIEIGKGKVEVAFDVGVITLASNNKRSMDLCEIEIEVKAGPEEILDKVREMVLDVAPDAKIQLLSKADQGARFYARGKKIKFD